ncbi:MFS transporter [Streptomyces morookaense]|uniref:MFS transporter n=1 Tax=Streptomyces morookaense TaxID=1970 RepID=A0A7Y7E821_STRMO|nr:MFS transporter [Streptomyces morookaense]NVK78974.1 MFS transporter [Streptomyces morookaense]GHF36469.1 MFS transporter [Streptomyces morookaense]
MTSPQTADRAADRPSWAPLAVVLIGGFIAFLDFFIVNVAIPSIQGDLDASAPETQLVMVGYGAALSVGLIAGGRLGDLFGPRRIFLTGLVLFTLSSAACGFAPSIWFLAVARVVQGLSSALLTPQVLAIVSHVYTGAAWGRAFSAYGLMLGLSGLCGQLIGGVLIALDVAGIGWRTVFLINIPIGLVILALTPRVIPEFRTGSAARLDLAGAALATVSLAAVVLPLLEGRDQGWPLWAWASLIAAVPLFALFVTHQRRLAARNGAPLIEPGLFRKRAFTVGITAYFVYFMSMGSFFLLFAIYMQEGRGWDPLPSGLLFTAMSAGFFGSSYLAGRIGARIGNQVIALGAGLVAAGYAVVGVIVAELGVDGTAGWLAPGLLVAGFGMGLVAAPLPAAAMTDVDPQHASAASGVLSTAMEGGAALGVSLVGLVFFGTLGHSPARDAYPRAFSLGIALIVVFPVIVILLAQALPRPGAGATDRPSRMHAPEPGLSVSGEL